VPTVLKVFSEFRQDLQHNERREIQEEPSSKRQSRAPCHYAGNFEFVVEEHQVRVRARDQHALSCSKTDLPRRVRGNHPQR
jgi:hypothetical protein